MAKAINRMLLSHFSDDAVECFFKNDKRAFIVEEVKHLAVKELESILKQERPDSFLMLSKDVKTAKEIESIVSSAIGKCTVIGSLEEARILINDGENIVDADGFIGRARFFRAQYPRIIIAAYEGNAPVFNAVLCQNKKTECLYNKDDKQSTPYTLSDFLAECRYSFVAVDDVYSMFSVRDFGPLKPEGERPVKDVTRFDRTEFRGMAYYTDLDHSMKKLRALTAGAMSCVILSDKIMNGSAVDFMFALQLITERVSVLSVKDKVAYMIDDYTDECGDIAYSIIPYSEDENIISDCMRLARGEGKRLPRDIPSVTEYIKSELAYLTPEEIFIRVVSAYQRAFPNVRINKTRDILDRLDVEPGDFSKCFVEMFFSDPIKEQVEGATHKAFFTEIADNEKETIIQNLLKIFFIYGVCHRYVENPSVKPYLFCREGDGFEDLVKRGKDRCPGVTYYSIMGNKSDFFYTGFFIQNLSKEKVLSPMLVVTDENIDEFCSVLEKFLPDYTVSKDWSRLEQEMREPFVAVCNYQDLHETALWLVFDTVLLADMPADIDILADAIKKASAFCDSSIYLLSRYGNIGGLIIEKMVMEMPEFFAEITPSVSLSDVMMAGRAKEKCGDVINELNETYTALGSLIKLSSDKAAQKTISQFNKVLRDYTNITPFAETETINDTKFLMTTGKEYSKICGAAVSFGQEAETICAGESKEKAIFFNVCAFALKHSCDVKGHNCNGCDRYERFFINDFSLFKEGIEEFFKNAKQVVSDIEENKREGGQRIVSLDSVADDKDVLSVFAIDNASKKANKTLQAITKKYADGKNGMFVVPYDPVKEIKEQTIDLYQRILDKYYSKIIGILEDAFGQIKTNYYCFKESLSQVNKG